MNLAPEDRLWTLLKSPDEHEPQAAPWIRWLFSVLNALNPGAMLWIFAIVCTFVYQYLYGTLWHRIKHFYRWLNEVDGMCGGSIRLFRVTFTDPNIWYPSERFSERYVALALHPISLDNPNNVVFSLVKADPFTRESYVVTRLTANTKIPMPPSDEIYFWMNAKPGSKNYHILAQLHNLGILESTDLRFRLRELNFGPTAVKMCVPLDEVILVCYGCGRIPYPEDAHIGYACGEGCHFSYCSAECRAADWQKHYHDCGSKAGIGMRLRDIMRRTQQSSDTGTSGPASSGGNDAKKRKKAKVKNKGKGKKW